MKRHVAEGFDIVIVKNMCNVVSLQIIYIVYDHYRLVYYSDTIFTVAHWIQLASFSNVHVEKRQHQLREFLQIQVRPLKHLNNVHMLSKRSGFSVRTWNITLLWPIMTANGVSYRINLFPSIWRIYQLLLIVSCVKLVRFVDGLQDQTPAWNELACIYI